MFYTIILMAQTEASNTEMCSNFSPHLTRIMCHFNKYTGTLYSHLHEAVSKVIISPFKQVFFFIQNQKK